MVTFDDLTAGTRVSNQYETSHGVTFEGGEIAFQPYVTSVGAAAHSGDRVGIYDCTGLPGCGEGFSSPRFRGHLSPSAASVSAYVGLGVMHGEGQTADVRLIAYAAGDTVVGQSGYVTVTEGAPFTQQVTATAAAGKKIDYFDIVADKPGDEGKAIGFDDLTITTPDTPQPADFTLNQGQGVVDIPLGTSADVPVTLNRINGSNGDISFAVSGLPNGVTASFAPNPVQGTATATTLTLTAGPGSLASDTYSTATVTATPSSAAAGPAARSINKLVRVRRNCEHEVRFPYLDARSDGCIVKQGHKHEIAGAEVHINGLIVKPADAGAASLIIDDEKKTVSSLIDTMRFSVAVDAEPDVALYTGPIDWHFADGGAGPHSVTGFKVNGARVLHRIPIAAVDASFLENGKATLKPALKLDFWPFNHFGAITTTTTFTTDNDHGADFSGLDIKLADINALGIELKNAHLAWQQGGTWLGEAKVVLRFDHPYTVEAGFGLKDGGFDFLRGSVAGLNISVGPGVFLNRIGFDVHRNPLQLIGTLGLSGGPTIRGVSAVSVDGALRALLADPFVVEITGKAKVANKFELADALLRYTSTGLFEFAAKAKFDLWRLHLDGGVDGWVDGLRAFNVEGSVNACLDVFGPNPCGDARVLLSSRGAAGCLGAYGYFVGAGATWDLDFDAFTGCDLTPYREVKPAGTLHAASTLTRTVLPKGLRSAAWEVIGDGTVPGPGITLTGPHGRTVTVSREVPFVRRDGFLAELLADGRTFVLMNKPEAGVWTLTGDGTVPVLRVREARGLPRPSVHATVKGKGRSRQLTWQLQPIPGQHVTFAEYGKDVRHMITTTSKRRGRVRFRPAEGPAGRRKIVALVQQNGLPRTTLIAGSYRAPGPVRPGRPSLLKVRRRGTMLTISWRPHPSGFRHAVYVALTDRRRIVRIVPARRRKVTIGSVRRHVGATVTVRGLTAANGMGPAGRARLKR